MYVFDGIPPYLKCGCRAKRKSDRERAGVEWQELQKKALELVGIDGPPFTDKEIMVATSAQISIHSSIITDRLIFLFTGSVNPFPRRIRGMSLPRTA